MVIPNIATFDHGTDGLKPPSPDMFVTPTPGSSSCDFWATIPHADILEFWLGRGAAAKRRFQQEQQNFVNIPHISRWFKVTFLSPNVVGHLTIPKRSHRIARQDHGLSLRFDPIKISKNIPTNIAPENRWYKMIFPLRGPIFKGYVSFLGCLPYENIGKFR